MTARALTLALVTALLVPAAAPAAAELTFSRPEADAGGVYIVKGSAKRRLVGGSSAIWSADGRRLAVVAGEAAALYAVDSDGRFRARIARGPVTSPDWSPDGRRLVFERSGSILVVEADGTDERRVAFGRSPAWSPGGRRIAFVSDRVGSDDIFVIRAAGGRLARVTSALGNESDPAWSPNGRRLAYVSDERGSPEIVVHDLARGVVAPLTNDSAIASAPAWSPDGRRIAFVSDRDGTEAVWTVAARGGLPRRIASGPAERPRWRPRPSVVELLPDLDQQPPTDLQVRTTGGRFQLWFTSATDNVGLGPFIVSGRRANTGSPVMHAVQRVRLSNGGTAAYPRIGSWRYNHSGHHSHWHLLYFQRYELRRQDGSVVVRDRKSGFCLGDRYGVAPGRIPNRIPSPVYTAFCNLHQPGALGVDGGTSVGYSDRYHSGLDGQNVDVTNVPAGRYVLVHRANPRLLIRELRYTNDAASVAIRLWWPNGRSRPPAVRVLRVCADSDRCR